MQVAIENSNSAILVMSQGFVDSMWCQQEFQYCHIEHMKDPAFRLFVIIMEPMESLQNLTECMKQYFVQETYLKKDDENLFKRIATYLTLVKKPKDDEYAPEGIGVNPGEEQLVQGNGGGISAHISADNQDVPGDIIQNHMGINDNSTNDNRNDGLVFREHENTVIDPEDDVNIVVGDVDDINCNDENVPLLVE